MSWFAAKRSLQVTMSACAKQLSLLLGLMLSCTAAKGPCRDCMLLQLLRLLLMPPAAATAHSGALVLRCSMEVCTATASWIMKRPLQ
jgi:hypothetical protein